MQQISISHMTRTYPPGRCSGLVVLADVVQTTSSAAVRVSQSPVLMPRRAERTGAREGDRRTWQMTEIGPSNPSP